MDTIIHALNQSKACQKNRGILSSGEEFLIPPFRGVGQKHPCWKYDWVLEFDIKGLFDNIDHELLMKAVQKHTDNPWVILYIKR
jgi:hypothetical protein